MSGIVIALPWDLVRLMVGCTSGKVEIISVDLQSCEE